MEAVGIGAVAVPHRIDLGLLWCCGPPQLRSHLKGRTFWGPLKKAKEEELWAAPVRCVLLWVIFVFILTLRYPTGRSRLVWW